MILVAMAALVAGIGYRALQSPQIKTLDGNEVSWQSEQWTVVNYFAEWCQPCLREIPELNDFYRGNSARVFGVSFDELNNEELQALVTRQRIEFPVVVSESADALPVSMPIVLPTTYIIAPGGEVAVTIRGEVTAEKLHQALSKP